MTSKQLSVIVLAFFAGTNIYSQQVFQGAEATDLCKGSKTVTVNKQSRVPSFVVFNEDSKITSDRIINVLRPTLKMQIADGLRSKNVVQDEIGITHERFTQLYNGIPVEGG